MQQPYYKFTPCTSGVDLLSVVKDGNNTSYWNARLTACTWASCSMNSFMLWASIMSSPALTETDTSLWTTRTSYQVKLNVKFFKSTLKYLLNSTKYKALNAALWDILHINSAVRGQQQNELGSTHCFDLMVDEKLQDHPCNHHCGVICTLTQQSAIWPQWEPWSLAINNLPELWDFLGGIRCGKRLQNCNQILF